MFNYNEKPIKNTYKTPIKLFYAAQNPTISEIPQDDTILLKTSKSSL
jgi:hypothetical protein